MARNRETVSVFVAVFALATLFSHAVAAGPLDEARAQAHVNAVAAGDLDAVMRDYDEDASLDWVGGALDGRYRGKPAIKAVWQKFIAANAGKPRPAKFSKPEGYANPKGASIEISAEYGGTTPVKVWHVLSYRDGVLGTEIWQIAPALQVAP